MNYSETLDLFRLPNRTELNMGSRNPNISIEPKSVLLHLNAFTWYIWCIWMISMSSIRSNRTRKNIEILKKFDSVRLDLVRYSRKVLEFHCKIIVKMPIEIFLILNYYLNFLSKRFRTGRWCFLFDYFI